jgi:ankyrin repeat protein
MSAQEGHINVVRLLVAEKNIDIDTRTENGRTPLFFAVSKNHVAVAQLLLARGANIMAKNRKGTTALPPRRAHEVVVRLLLEKGASP